MKQKDATRQKHPFGCGATCVAFVLGLDYSTALKLFEDGENKAINRGFYCRDIVDALMKKGLYFEFKYLKPKIRQKIYQNYSIVFIKRSKAYPSGHYLCRHNNLWMDPWFNLKENHDVSKARANFRKRLPGKPIYVFYAR